MLKKKKKKDLNTTNKIKQKKNHRYREQTDGYHRGRGVQAGTGEIF